jgi:hypothetical protein
MANKIYFCSLVTIYLIIVPLDALPNILQARLEFTESSESFLRVDGRG